MKYKLNKTDKKFGDGVYYNTGSHNIGSHNIGSHNTGSHNIGYHNNGDLKGKEVIAINKIFCWSNLLN